MKTQRDYQQRQDQKLQLHSESPQVLHERQSTGSELNHISPIPTLSLGSSGIQSQNTNEKPINSKDGNLINPYQRQTYNYGQTYQKYDDGVTPNNLVQEFYKKPNYLNDADDNEFYLEDNELEEDGYNSNINRNDYGQGAAINLYGASSGLNTYAQSTGNQNKQGSSKALQRDLKKATCTEFDMTAKEINSNKRFEKQQKNTILSGRTSHSPIDGQPSNSETVKWAFSNKDSQETQKKISIINRESINAQEMISRSLKSHDSRAQLSQQTTSSKNIPILKGKILDFVNIDHNQQNLDSELFYQNSHNKMNSGQTFDSNSNNRNEEEKMISFLEDETELLMSSNKKILANKNIAGIQYKKHAGHLNNGKYLSKQKFNIPEALQSFIDNTIECPLCNQQKVFDSSLQCSRIEQPKSCMDVIKLNLNKKYLTSREYYNVKIINDIIYNEQTHIVSVFKDYLIFDDISEFLKRFYNKLESIQRLPRMFEFYEKYSKVFPNYVTLPENKYLFKNIEKKQRIIDEKQRILQEQEERKQKEKNQYQLGTSAEKPIKSRHKDRFSSQQMNSSMNSNHSTNRMFDTKFIDSVANIKASGFIESSSMQSSRINNSQYQEHVMNSSILIQQHLQENMDNAAKNKKKKKALQDLDFGELISKFIAKDSESNIQQSSILPDNYDSDQKQPLTESSQNRPSSQLTQKKPQVYEYQEKRLNQQPALIILNTDNSKTISDGVSSGRPTSSKQDIEIKTKIQSIPPQTQIQPNSARQNTYANEQRQQQVEVIQDGKVHNYNNQPPPNHLIINNFVQDKNQVQKQGDIIINIASSNIITSQNMPDRNYFDYNIYNNYNQYPPNYPGVNPDNIAFNIKNQDQDAKLINTGNVSSRQGSLQRNPSRSNLHNAQQLQQMSQKTNEPGCHTPLRNNLQKEVKTPGSGHIHEEKIQTNLVQNKILKRIKNQVKPNLAQSDQQQNLISLSGNNKSTSLLQKSEKNQTQSPLNIYSQRNPIYTMNVNSVKSNTDAVVSRELSKEKRQTQNSKQNVFVNQQQLQSSNSNQMFKNEIIMNIANKINESKALQLNAQYQNNMPDYSTTGPHSTNVRSVERLKNIEEEIQKDYSKYVNEYGLSKTAFAKAVNSLRDKQTINTQQAMQVKQQQISSQPSTTRQARLAQNSNEKKRTASNNPRSGSTSQNRKQSNSRQQNYKNGQQAQESINDLYLNTNRNDQKQIRSVRAKTHLSSQNSSSCYQRSTKLSPDKISQSQIGNSNALGLTQTINGQFNSNSSSNYITLKAKPTLQSKGIKIKFPLNSQRGTTKQQNSSQNQTPKRIKLQKTKSTSNIPLSFTSRGLNTQSNVLLSQRNRVPGQDMMIMDEMSYQMNATNPTLQYIPLNQARASQNFQELYPQNDNQIMNPNMFQQQTFNSNSCIGTYTTTSILNSPMSFKNQVGFIPQSHVQQQQIQQTTRNNSKGRQTSRNGATSQHQSQKSINNGHQRATSNNGVLQSSNNKNKKVTALVSGDSKRMSAGSNLSKKQQQFHHQASQSNMQQQILQLLMSYQTQQDPDATGTSVQQNMPQNSTLKLLQSNNTQSMKDLKSLKQQPTSNLIKDLQIIRAPKQNIHNQGGLAMQQQQPSLNTQRAGAQSILMVNNQNQRKQSKAGKLTSRGDGSKKRVIQQQNIVIPYQSNDCTTSISNNNQYSNIHGNMTSNDLSSRIQTSLAMNYGDQTQSQMESKRLLSQSKSQENFDMIRVAAHRAALEQQTSSQYNGNSTQAASSASNKFLQNLKQQENQISMQKIKMMPPSAFQQIPLQSAKNIQFDSNVNFRSSNENDQQQQHVQYSKGATNIIIGQNFEKPSSRRTSGKFNPQSTRSNQQ